MELFECDPSGKASIISRLTRYLRVMGLEGLLTSLLPQQSIVDFGCGLDNPLAVGVILYANGCQEMICYEKFLPNRQKSLSNIKVLINMMYSRPQNFKFSGVSEADFIERLNQVNPEYLNLLTDHPNDQYYIPIAKKLILTNDLDRVLSRRPTFCFSNSVIEHILDLDEALSFFRTLSERNVIQVHTVDFADHRFYKSRKSKVAVRSQEIFAFYEADSESQLMIHDTNLLRTTELEALFSHYDLGYQIIDTQFAPPTSIHGLNLREHLQNLPTNELLVWVRGYLLFGASVT